MKRLIAVVAALALSGCSLLSTNTTVQLAVQAAIDAGVGIVLAKAPGEAAPLAAAALALQSLAAGSTTSVAQLVSDADNKIAALPGLNPPEKAALEEVVTLAASTLAGASSKLTPTTSFDLQLIFGDIANAANLYVSTSLKAASLRR